MPQYAILVYAPAPADWVQVPPEELEAHGRTGEVLAELGGQEVAGYALQPSTTARSVRSNGVTEGPFVEAKEVIGGFGVIEARDLDHAVDIAKRNPATWRGGIEVRPILEPPE